MISDLRCLGVEVLKEYYSCISLQCTKQIIFFVFLRQMDNHARQLEHVVYNESIIIFKFQSSQQLKKHMQFVYIKSFFFFGFRCHGCALNLLHQNNSSIYMELTQSVMKQRLRIKNGKHNMTNRKVQIVNGNKPDMIT